MQDNLRLIRDRMAYWNARGLSGEAFYRALASDSALPHAFTPGEAAEVVGITINSLKSRRARGQAPSFRKLSRRDVQYPRADLFEWLLSGYVKRPDTGHVKDAYSNAVA